ncbi:MAG: phosphoadenosine phosphosulfate reductase family protein [bacterium]|nr:phosphoadenosine phosphosulfate reductase family protein [bacterium]
MAIKRKQASISVVEAAKIRIRNVFKNGVKVYMSFSGGKDSLCLSHLVLQMIQSGEIEADNLTVIFIDEEAIFPCIEETVKDWRKKFLMAGAKFEWYCVECRHYNCFNELTNDESFICWDRYKEAVWVRRPPKYAVRTHPMFKPREDTYQEFCYRMCNDGITITGVRMSESIQRLKNVAATNKAKHKITKTFQVLPIYDWSDKDVWLFLLRENIKIPEVYLFLWQIGTGRRQLRVSQLFSIDTARTLVNMNEYYPDLMERIVRREPNAYLAALYWDSEMFGRNTRKRAKLEDASENKKDYKAELLIIFGDIDKYFPSGHKRETAIRYRKLFLQVCSFATNKDCRQIYESIMSGDPKLRNFRAIYHRIYSNYINRAKAERGVK